MNKTPLIQIFKAGRFTSMEGAVVELSDADLAATAAAYDRQSDPAPLVIGHPKHDDPAYGWVEGLSVQDGRLVASPDPKTLEPAFAEAVRRGRYRKVSARFYPPTHPGNPKPGSWYLKHLGFLGAAAPGVKGLGTVSFTEAEEGLITLEPTNLENSMSEPTEPSFAEREADLARREAEIAEREQAATAAVRQALHASNVSFAEQLVTSGRLQPRGKDLLVGVMDELDAVATVSFGEADGELTPLAAFRKLLEGAQPLISFTEEAPRDENDGDQDTASFAAPAGYGVDPRALKIHERALELQSANSNLSYLDAVRQAGG